MTRLCLWLLSAVQFNECGTRDDLIVRPYSTGQGAEEWRFLVDPKFVSRPAASHKDITNPNLFELADVQSCQSIHEAFWGIKHSGNLFVRNRYEARLRYKAGVQAVVTMYLWPRELVPPLIAGFTVNASRLIETIEVG